MQREGRLSGIKFSPGSVVVTPGVLAAFTEAGDDPLAYLVRHIAGDWGEVNAEDWQANERPKLYFATFTEQYSNRRCCKKT